MNGSLATLDLPVHDFTLLTNHTNVLVVIAKKPDIRMREVAAAVGITERAVQRIVDDLTACGYLVVTKDGRRNRYEIQPHSPLKHHWTTHRNIGELIQFMYPQYQP